LPRLARRTFRPAVFLFQTGAEKSGVSLVKAVVTAVFHFLHSNYAGPAYSPSGCRHGHNVVTHSLLLRPDYVLF
jgi:hypothetical protein